jgi:hypothetical protein
MAKSSAHQPTTLAQMIWHLYRWMSVNKIKQGHIFNWENAPLFFRFFKVRCFYEQ